MNDKDITELSEQQTKSGSIDAKSLAEAASDINLDMKEEAVARQAKSSGGRYGYIDIAKTPINPDLYYLIDADKAKSALAVPFFRLGKKLRVAVADPDNSETKKVLDDFTSQGYELQINLATSEGILKAVELFHQAQKGKCQEIETEVKEDELEAYQKEIENLSKLAQKIQVSSAKEGLNTLYLGAIKTKASDIHFQPEEKDVLIRFRIDGILQNVSRLKKDVYKQLAQQIKYDADMKLNVSDIPQDGRTNFVVNNRKIDVRVSALPTEFGETLVLRVLDSGKKFAEFQELGFTDKHLEILNTVSALSQGMILVTGPTGSGKTTTLYTLLTKYNTPERKIITLEDPVEYHLVNIVQSQIDEKKGYTFAKGLESILRQDPDVVMIGEIRDLDTANTAVQAALTGHVMLSTLHTNSALESIPRLLNIGLNPYMVSPALDTLIAQRLVRTFCPHCVSEGPVDEAGSKYLAERIKVISQVTGQKYKVPSKLPAAKGCAKCNHTGYLGRLVIAEMVRMDDQFRQMILDSASLSELRKHARETGMLTMLEDGILKVIAGKTSLEELRRVTA